LNTNTSPIGSWCADFNFKIQNQHSTHKKQFNDISLLFKLFIILFMLLFLFIKYNNRKASCKFTREKVSLLFYNWEAFWLSYMTDNLHSEIQNSCTVLLLV
jgi:hypothetical protein